MTPWGVFSVFLVLALVIGFVFAYVGLSTKTARQVDYGAANRVRQRFFIVLTGALVVVLALTLPRMPYPAETQKPDRIVYVAGKQYAFALSETPIETVPDGDEASYSQSVEVPLGSLVEFRVGTLDVNHGFSVYSPEGGLIAQTQAMPGYVNRLRVHFERPGTYTVLCLEYCGMGHHRMRGVVDVK
jgi:cytochrome c oxidase subunit II